MEYELLSGIKSPDDVKKLNDDEITRLCGEIRSCIIETVSKNGGHLASNLGAVELTVALHRVFSAPDDAIIFDVGHQSYTHKLLTGRYDRFGTIRTKGGLSGFMRPSESEYDPIVTGHSSNSISAAYGIYKAKQLLTESGTAIAVIGDGAMTGGMAYEALNNAGNSKTNFIVVLNDNKMSISRNVGSLSRAFTRLRNRPRYHHFKFAINTILYKLPLIGKPISNVLLWIKQLVKRTVYPDNVFSALGFSYFGPVNGHDEVAVESLLRIAKGYSGPCLVHVVTTKGKGYAFAENKPKNYHGVSPFDVETGESDCCNVTYSDAAGSALCALAENNDRICAVTAAMTQGTGLTEFAKKYKNRFFDVGIAEQHAVTFCAGLAKCGMIPFFAVYSSFLQRGYDQILHDAAIGNVPIKLLVDRAGIVGEDGESHQGLFDAAYLSSIPNVFVYSPCGYKELKNVIEEIADNGKLCAVRYPRGCEKDNYDSLFSGDYTVVSNNKKAALVTYGRLFSYAVDANTKKNFDIVKLNVISPVAKEFIDTLWLYDDIHFFEEGIKNGGIAERVGNMLLESGYSGKFRVHAIDSQFVPAAEVSQSLSDFGLDTAAMTAAFAQYD